MAQTGSAKKLDKKVVQPKKQKEGVEKQPRKRESKAKDKTEQKTSKSSRRSSKAPAEPASTNDCKIE